MFIWGGVGACGAPSSPGIFSLLVLLNARFDYTTGQKLNTSRMLEGVGLVELGMDEGAEFGYG